MRYKGASGSAKEIILILAFAAGLVIVFYMLAKREAEAAVGSIGKAAKEVIDNTIKIVSAPVTEYIVEVDTQSAAWKARVQKGQIPAIEPRIELPVLGEKDVYSIPSGGGKAFGSGTKEEDFIDIGYGVLIPKSMYFYNIRVW